jgi:histidyl-tRNA synthetase
MPNEALYRNEVIRKIAEVFQRFGFLTIDTPAFESVKVLNAKGVIGEDTKLIYEMKYEDIALKYDHTVSLARYMAMHQSLPQPFKRYFIGKAWRREEPQRLRYREFTQADVDIVGGRQTATDAEIIAVGAAALSALGIDFSIHVNSRKFMDDLFKTVGVPQEKIVSAMRAVDKLDKIGKDGVIEQLQKLGLDRDTVSKVDALINFEGTNGDKLDYLEKTILDKASVRDMRDTMGLLELYNLKPESIVIDFSIIRGLDYYTGIVFEYKSPDENSTIAAGGRYDKLIGTFSGKDLPAVGVSLGLDRLLDILEFSASPKHTYANVYMATINDGNYQYALQVATILRSHGIAVDLNVASRNISNQLAYANALSFKYAIIIGDAEEKEKNVKIRNLIDGTESSSSVQDALLSLKK